jgi:transposase
MKSVHFMGLDAHCATSELKAVTPSGRLTHIWKGPTTIPALKEAIEGVPRPRRLAIEEGAITDWLWRNLSAYVDELVVCDPRRNHLIANEGDKDDPIDAEKLAQLLRGGYLKPVHHPESFERAAFKHHVALYHDLVRQRVRIANHVMAYMRHYGVFIKEKAFAEVSGRDEVLDKLPNHRVVRSNLLLLWKGYQTSSDQVRQSRRRLVLLARKEPQIRQFTALPGISWIRAATFFVFVDTPWRFKSKSALWKYLGIGLERRRSGAGPGQLYVARQANHVLKGTIVGAAKSAIASGDNPFAEQYRRCVEQGISLRNARRNVARSQAATLWGMWKNGGAYRPEWVGVCLAEKPLARS